MGCLCSECTVNDCERKKSLQKRRQGKRNRNTGRYIEDKLLKLLKSWNLPAEKTIASGSMKVVSNRLKGQKYLFSGDLYTTGIVKGKRIKIESKKRAYKLFKKYYEITKQSNIDYIVHIKGLCYLMQQNDFYNLIRGSSALNIDIIEDKQNKSLHSYFNQDNADIVTLISPDENSNKYLPFIFCLREKTFNEIMKERYEVTKQ